MHINSETRRALRGTCRVWPAVLLLSLTACTANTGPGLSPQSPAGDETIWAIRCAVFTGSDGVRVAQSCGEALKKVSKLKPALVQVLNTDEGSLVYYGRYQRQYDPAKNEQHFKPDPRADLELIRSLSVVIRDRLAFPFIYAMPEELPLPRSSHPEWNLAGADGYWSLQVAVFYNTDTITNRKYLAEEYCRELRGQGLEAYFHHGSTNSSVFVGLFGKNAVQNVAERDPLTGAWQASNRIVDEKLLALQQRFPDNLENGQRVNQIVRDRATGEVKERIPLASFIVKTPKAEQAEKAAEQSRRGGGS